MLVMLMDDGVALAAGYEVAIDRERGHEGDREREGEAAPKEQARQARLHRAGDHEQYEVVHDLHDGDRERVRGEGQRQDRPEGETGPQQRQHRQQVAEEERQHDRQRYRGEVAPPERGPITTPRTSPMAHPVRQCAVALKASLFSEALFPCISVSSLPFRVPFIAPGLHLRDLALLRPHDLSGELFYLRVVALLERHVSHLDRRPVVRDHGPYERPVERLLVGQRPRVRRHAYLLHLTRLHVHRYAGGAELFLPYSFQLIYLGLLGGDYVFRELPHLFVLGVLERDLCHLHGPLVVRNHGVDEPLVGVPAVLHEHPGGHLAGVAVHPGTFHTLHVGGAPVFSRAVSAHPAVVRMPGASARPAAGRDGQRDRRE